MTIPDTCISIGGDAFDDCSDLNTVTIPENVAYIGDYAFGYCSSLTAIEVSPDNLNYASDNGILYTVDMTSLIQCPCGKTGTVEIPDGVTSIGSFSFAYCKALNSVTIPGSVSAISDYTFRYCPHLTSVKLAEGIKTIGVSSFDSCSLLASISIPGSVVSIGDYAFISCSSLESMYLLPMTEPSVGDNWIGGTPTTLLGHASAASTDYAPPGGTWYDLRMGDYISGDFLYKVDIGEVANITGYVGIGGAVVIPTTLDTMDVVGIADTAFYGNLDMTSVTFGSPSKVAYIGNEVFDQGSNLVSISIPASVKTIGEETFSYCSQLTTVTFEPTSTLNSIGAYAFGSCTVLTGFTIPESVTFIDQYAFDHDYGLSSITIPAKVSLIGPSAFNACTGLASITVAGANPSYSNHAGDGVLYDKTVKTLYQYPGGKAGTFTIPSGVTNVADNAFFWCSSLTALVIPNGVTTIGINAFESCTGLLTVRIAGSVSAVGDSAFYNCNHLEFVNISNGASVIGNSMFNSCWSLLNVSMPDSITSIGDQAFHGCLALASITIPAGVSSIGDYSFYSCTHLTSMRFNGTVAPTVAGPDWITLASSSLLGHAYPGSGFPLPGSKFHDLMMGTQIEMTDSLTMATNFGTTTPSMGVHSVTGSVQISATAPTAGPNERYVFAGWTGTGTGSYTGPVNTVTITMNGPITETANWWHQYQISMSANFGTYSPINGYWANASSTVTITATPDGVGSGERYVFLGWTGTGTGSYGSTSQSHDITVGGPITEHASWSHEYQLTITTNTGTFTPTSLNWYAAGTSVDLTAFAPGVAYGERYPFMGWTGNGYTGLNNPSSVTMNSAVSETASWAHQYLVSFLVTPWGAGTAVPSGIGYWVDAGAFPISATPIGSYTFAGWTSDTTGITFVDAASTATVANIGGPGNMTATFNGFVASVTIASNPGTDGYLLVDGKPITTPHTFTWASGENHTLEAAWTIPVSWGEQYAFYDWTDIGVQSHTYTVLLQTDTVTANYDHQYLLTLDSIVGVITPGNGGSWHNAGSVVGISAEAPTSIDGERNHFDNWTGTGMGSYNGTTNAVDVTMNGPVNETAYWTLQYRLVMATNFGTTTPVAGEHWYNVTTPVDITAFAPTATAGERYLFNGWTHVGVGGYTGMSNPMTVTMNQPINQTASWTRQYTLTMATNTGTTSPGTGDHWFNASSQVQISAVAASVPNGERYVFNHWTGSGTGGYFGSDNSVSVTMGGPITETANWTLQFQLTMITSFGTTIPSAGDHWFNVTAGVSISAIAPTETAGVRYVFAGWTETGIGGYSGSTNAVTVTMNAPITQIASWTVQYRLTMAVNIGTTDPGAGERWYDATTTLNINSTAAVAPIGYRYTFLRWEGVGFGSYSGSFKEYTVTMNGPITETAVWQAPNTLTLTITSPANNSYQNSSTVTVSWVVTDQLSSVISTEINTGGNIWTPVTGNSYSMSMLYDAIYFFKVRVIDLAGNVNSTAVTFTVDTVSPTLTITSLANGIHLNSTAVTVAWIVNDTGSGLARTEISTDGSIWMDVAGTSSSLTMPEGSRTVYIRVTDNAGNSRTVWTAFVVDTTAPTLTTRYPTGTSESTRAAVKVTFSEAMDRNGTTMSIGGVLGKLTWTGNNATFTPSMTLKGKTTYTVTVSGTDLAGNHVSSSWTFKTARVGWITGIVYGHNGKPLDGVVVSLIGHTGAQTGMSYWSLDLGTYDGITLTTTTDANGSYSFYDVAIGNYTLEVTEDGYATQDTPVSMTSAGVDIGGVTMDQTVAVKHVDDAMLYIGAIAAIVVVLLVLVVLVRRKKGPASVVPSAKDKGTEVAKKGPEEGRSKK